MISLNQMTETVAVIDNVRNSVGEDFHHKLDQLLTKVREASEDYLAAQDKERLIEAGLSESEADELISEGSPVITNTANDMMLFHLLCNLIDGNQENCAVTKMRADAIIYLRQQDFDKEARTHESDGRLN